MARASFWALLLPTLKTNPHHHIIRSSHLCLFFQNRPDNFSTLQPLSDNPISQFLQFFFLFSECSFVSGWCCFLSMCVSKYKKLCFCVVYWLCNGSVLAMASSEESSNSKKLDETPTWAVACVCTVFILISITLEKSLHKVGTVCHQFFFFFEKYYIVRIFLSEFFPFSLIWSHWKLCVSFGIWSLHLQSSIILLWFIACMAIDYFGEIIIFFKE